MRPLLRNCPCCDKQADYYNIAAHKHRVYCSMCLLETATYPSEELAAKAWNARPAATEASLRIGAWLSAALEDPKVCKEMKEDVRAWFDEGWPPHLTEPIS